ncbi:MAG: hypothetical protein WA902_17270, partial [Thermosynechococcaceae cyanobacterium]
FIVVHIISGYLRYKQMSFLYLENSDFSLVKDGSYSEIFQSTKELLAAVLLTQICIRNKSKIFGVWSLFFTYIFIDDTFGIHERFGKFLASQTEMPSILGLEVQDLGELLVYGFVGSAFVLLMLLAGRHHHPILVEESRNLAFLTIILIVFGLGFDLIHAALASVSFIVGALFSVIEDGGEMVAMSLIFWYIFNLWKYSGIHRLQKGWVGKSEKKTP